MRLFRLDQSMEYRVTNTSNMYRNTPTSLSPLFPRKFNSPTI